MKAEKKYQFYKLSRLKNIDFVTFDHSKKYIILFTTSRGARAMPAIFATCLTSIVL